MTKKRFSKFIFLCIVFFFLIQLVNLVWKIPLEGKKRSNPLELSTHYYKGLLGGLYMRGFRDCGDWLFSTCNTPDAFPFLRDRIVKGANPDSFVFVGSYSKPSDWSQSSDIYKDIKHIIIGDEIISGSDPQSIQIMDGYAKDKDNVYMYGSVFRDLDTSTFEFLSCGFFRDTSNVYNIFYENGKKPLNFIDKNSFEMVDRNGKACNLVPYVAKDKNSLYQSDASGVRIVGSNSN
ncbi:hypothetical protein COT86_02350 [Candidatus Collierbacteria bacterium CG10_big_fil_rev_8_21_14_0_10_43_36]|uniref:DKNYY family protein n=1 Tax=Candidatus Collierbacteria bacterium CG10_big_fil_rev_8_21_14_0_10_43_36 TaxID=1974534 RepID=A0A2H0VKW7_9BACT|nr:MAG: hypothetical protein COT86_02350 [Candidatus Collierbacteria bacterium CG10_big_fil_rev_8_21_14_0_10_43_36]